jgi:hypothetical protein
VLGRPGDQVVPEEHDIARRGATSVREANPAGRAVTQQAEVRHPTKIAQDALHGHQVELARVMHVQADLLQDISDVGPCECQVLEGSNNALELRGNRNRRPQVISQLHLEVDWSKMMNRKETLNHVRSNQNIVKVKWPGKNRVTY